MTEHSKEGQRPPAAVRPVAVPASMKRRHWGLVISFAVTVLAPLLLIAGYLWFVATDQYASKTGFTVRSEEGGSASALLGGLAQFTAGGGVGSDNDILYEYIQSQDIVETIAGEIDLPAIYSRHWPADPVFALRPDPSIEDLVSYWQRVVRISYDQSSGLIDLRVVAFTREEAKAVAEAIVKASQATINEINVQARADLMGYAEDDLQKALDRLKDARQALTRFRTQNRILDPEEDIRSQNGVLANLQQQLAQALIELDVISGNATSSDPRVEQTQRRIQVIRNLIADERKRFAEQDVSGAGTDYPTLISEYEGLSVDREYAEESYRAALTALDSARDNFARQSRYLALYVRPTLAQEAEYPQRLTLFSLAGLFLLMGWGILALVYYSVRDRK